jgi:hypothetical protein
VRLIRKALERHDHALRKANTGPAMLARVRALMGEADHRLYDHGVDDRRFRPDLASFSDGELCRYEFRAMRYPLMVGDVDLILRRPPSPGSTRPFVLAHERGADSAFGELWREITQIVNSVPRHEDGEDWRWDIPTVAEWLTLAGCLAQPFPWGHAPPTPEHANLEFDATTRLSPVGTFVAGRSSAGIYDCCGGVNEIVRELPYRMFRLGRLVRKRLPPRRWLLPDPARWSELPAVPPPDPACPGTKSLDRGNPASRVPRVR